MRKRLVLVAACLLLAASSLPAQADMSKGQTLYVPCASQTFHGPKSRAIDLTITLNVRNTDPRRSITVTAVDYHRTDGRLVRRYLDKPLVLGPLAVREIVVDQEDNVGGSAASFLVRWRSDVAANEPLVEAVMITTSNSLGISFTSRGVAIQE